MKFFYRQLLVSIGLISLGCGSDATGPAVNATAQQYWRLTLNHHAITMALMPPYDTIQLGATPRTVTGTPLADTGTTTYAVDLSDDDCGCNSVTVSPTGLLTAIGEDAGIVIYAYHTIGDVTLTDSAYVNINDVSSVPVFATLTIQQQPRDINNPRYNNYIANDDPFVFPIALDAQGNQINSALWMYSSNESVAFTRVANPTKGTFSVTLTRTGQTVFYAEATIYGVHRADSLLYTVTAPLATQVSVLPSMPEGTNKPVGFFSPDDDTVAVGATVVWLNGLSPQPSDVVFDTPSAAQSVDSVQFLDLIQQELISSNIRIPNQSGGDIPEWNQLADTTGFIMQGGVPVAQTLVIGRARRFPTAGVYPYHSAVYGTTGVIHVVPQ